MSDNESNTSTSSQSNDWFSARTERRMARAQRRAERRAARYAGGGTWVVGVALIILGGVFMFQNMGALLIHNWWALFILLPALGSFATAYGAYRSSGRLTPLARNSLVGGLILTAIAGFFLLDLDWARWWPTLLILAGVGALATAVLPD
jgi:hypothetical protein